MPTLQDALTLLLLTWAWAALWQLGAPMVLGLSARGQGLSRSTPARPAAPDPPTEARRRAPVSFEDSLALATIRREMARDSQRFWMAICGLLSATALAIRAIGPAGLLTAAAGGSPSQSLSALGTAALLLILLWIGATLERSRALLAKLGASGHGQLQELGLALAAVSARADAAHARADQISSALVQLTVVAKKRW